MYVNVVFSFNCHSETNRITSEILCNKTYFAAAKCVLKKYKRFFSSYNAAIILLWCNNLIKKNYGVVIVGIMKKRRKS